MTEKSTSKCDVWWRRCITKKKWQASMVSIQWQECMRWKKKSVRNKWMPTKMNSIEITWRNHESWWIQFHRKTRIIDRDEICASFNENSARKKKLSVRMTQKCVALAHDVQNSVTSISSLSTCGIFSVQFFFTTIANCVVHAIKLMQFWFKCNYSWANDGVCKNLLSWKSINKLRKKENKMRKSYSTCSHAFNFHIS